MPVYEYKCTDCDELFEIKQSFNDKPVTVCHRCGKEARRVFKPAPIIFKGSGFYITDHAKDKETKPENKKHLEKTNSSTEPATDSAGTDSNTKEKATDSSPVNKKEEGSVS